MHQTLSLTFYKCTMRTEDNAGGDIAIHVNGIALENDDVCIVQDRYRQYIYRILGLTVTHIKNGYIYIYSAMNFAKNYVKP